MNKLLFMIATAAVGVSFMACESKLDIVPKGQTTLDRTEELEMLLNKSYDFQTTPSDLGMIPNVWLSFALNVSNMLQQQNSLNYVQLTYDESVDRIPLCVTDARYNSIYKYINTMNVIVEQAPESTGDDALKRQIVAEARVMRAHLHFLIANMHAAQYDDTTAATLGGIAYVTDTNLGEVKQKLTLQETYSRMLEDCSEEVIADLPRYVNDVNRADQAFGNAVRAKILFQMKHYAEAIPYARRALDINGHIEDRSVVASTRVWSMPRQSENNYVFMSATFTMLPYMVVASRETSQLFDPNDYVCKYEASGGWSETSGQMFGGISGVKCCVCTGAQENVYGIKAESVYYLLAECLIRMGEIDEGLSFVDRVRESRIEDCAAFSGTVSTEKEAMQLLERAKIVEFIATCEPFFDFRRWNSETDYRRTITRDLGEFGTYSLSPDSPLWILPFPAEATRLNPTLTQNF